jgi:CRP-like cAMP-binding protein
MVPSLFDALPEEDRRDVLRVARRRRFTRKEVVFHEGDPGDTLHLVVKGHVAVRITTPLGDEGILRVLGPGQVFGELALIDPAPRAASVVAITPCESLSIHSDHLTELRQRHPPVDDLILAAVVGELRRVSALLVEAMYLPVEKRLHRRLLDLASLFGDTIPLTQTELAQLTGATRSTVNRVLQVAEEAASVRVRRGRIEVLDQEALERRSR